MQDIKVTKQMRAQQLYAFSSPIFESHLFISIDALKLAANEHSIEPIEQQCFIHA